MIGVGIDGCRGGWLAVILGPGGQWQYRLDTRLETIISHCPEDSRILLDMPLGLLDGPASERDCDQQARQRLGWPRAASVFTPPARSTLAAADYPQALLINRQHLGKGLSRQAWNLAPKIREADRLRREQPELEGHLFESHPELCFWALNNQYAPQHSKKSKPGHQERLAILQGLNPQAADIAQAIAASSLRREIARDDILDALVLAVSASCDHLIHLPEQICRDGYGIPMEIVYAVSSNIGTAS